MYDGTAHSVMALTGDALGQPKDVDLDPEGPVPKPYPAKDAQPRILEQRIRCPEWTIEYELLAAVPVFQSHSQILSRDSKRGGSPRHGWRFIQVP